jgi:hypothetical protein
MKEVPCTVSGPLEGVPLERVTRRASLVSSGGPAEGVPQEGSPLGVPWRSLLEASSGRGPMQGVPRCGSM